MTKPLAEITLRKYEKPYEQNMYWLVRKFCLSIGLLQPKDTRDAVVWLLLQLINARKNNRGLTTRQLQQLLLHQGKKVALSNVRRLLKKLRDTGVVEKQGNVYVLAEQTLVEIVDRINRLIVIPALIRAKEYAERIDSILKKVEKSYNQEKK